MAKDDNKAKEKAIAEWLRTVDKPVGMKEGDKKDKGSSDK
jgi:hypothetical protein